MKNVRMTFGDGTTVGILVQAVDIHFDEWHSKKWYCSMFRLIAPSVLMNAFLGASAAWNNILFTSEDGSRCRVNGLRSQFIGISVATQDMIICEAVSFDVDEVTPLEKGPTHYEDFKEQTLVEASSVSEEPEDPEGSKDAEGVGGSPAQEEGKDSPGGPTFPGDFMC